MDLISAEVISTRKSFSESTETTRNGQQRNSESSFFSTPVHLCNRITTKEMVSPVFQYHDTPCNTSKRPTQLHLNGPNPGTLLLPSATVYWVWRMAKCKAVGIETSAFHLYEVPEITQGNLYALDQELRKVSQRYLGRGQP